MKLAIDLGGTNIRIAQIEGGNCLTQKSVACLAEQDAATVLKQLIDLIQSMMSDQVQGIGIGVPSIVDSERGIVYNAANIASWKEIHLKEILEKEFSVEVAINNDSNCFALGQSLFGDGLPYNNMVGITIGTGIGTGVIIGKHLYCGLYAGAGEVGSLPYLDSDYEHYCSSSFFVRHYGITGLEAAHRATQGNKEALKIWEEFGKHIGHLMKAILFTYAPQAIILGGGIASAFAFYEESMRKTMNTFPYQVILDRVQIIPSDRSDISLLGASALL